MTTATAIKTRPILFSGAMVKAILEGRKNQTRRVVKRADHGQHVTALVQRGWGMWQHHFNNGTSDKFPDGLLEMVNIKCPYGRVGDRLWVRETWRPALSETHECFAYRADMKYHRGKDVPEESGFIKWKPSIFMPHAASRITLEVTDVQVQRLQDISEEDAIAEGVERNGDSWKCYGNCESHKAGHDKRTSATASFMSLWDSINADKYPWDSNPWVWAVSFRRVAA